MAILYISKSFNSSISQFLYNLFYIEQVINILLVFLEFYKNI